MERPNIPPDSTERQILMIFNYIFTVVFGAEMFIKVIAQGLLHGKGAYFSSGWNVMDGSLVIISFIDVLMSVLATTSPRIFGILRVFRLLRALRPLRVINRAPGLKLVVQTLLSSLQPIGNIVLICCTFFIIFGILGVQLFKGTFFYCDGPDISEVVTRNDCLTRNKENLWLNRKYNFDDLGQALMSLFVLSSKDGWVNIMYTGLDAVGVDLQPVENYSQWRLLYFISFLLLVGFFVLNMFVGVVVENFHRCREEQEKEEKARRAAKRAKKLEKKRKKYEKIREERVKSLIAAGIDPSSVDIDGEIRRRRRRKRELMRRKLASLSIKSQGNIQSLQPDVMTVFSKINRSWEMREPPYYSQYSKARLFIHNIVTSKYFDLAIAAVIGLNVVTMAMEFYKMPKEQSHSTVPLNRHQRFWLLLSGVAIADQSSFYRPIPCSLLRHTTHTLIFSLITSIELLFDFYHYGPKPVSSFLIPHTLIAALSTFVNSLFGFSHCSQTCILLHHLTYTLMSPLHTSALASLTLAPNLHPPLSHHTPLCPSSSYPYSSSSACLSPPA
ncbi:Voltage-dependent T-type calcium channel subunit alpha-1G [Halocaridina rubra]|uniref:Voltage-dependent T-type calcium channel subunit alpha-1G n=1 Tax=Halocaridina rubra TaxID=373956 RepID=A0AAN9A1C3_HALRR